MCSNGSDFKVHESISYAVVKALRNHRVKITVENRVVTAVLPARSPLATKKHTSDNQTCATASSGTCSGMPNSATSSGALGDQHGSPPNTGKGAYSALSDSESDCFAEASDEADDELPEIVPLKEHRSRNKSSTPTVEEATTKENRDDEGECNSTDKVTPKGKGKGKKKTPAEKEELTKSSVNTPQCTLEPGVTDPQVAETASQIEGNNPDSADPGSATSKRKRKATQDPSVPQSADGDFAGNTAVPTTKVDVLPQVSATVAPKAMTTTGPAPKRRKQTKN